MTVQGRRTTLGQALIERGLLTPEQLETALEEQKHSGEFLGTILTRLGIVQSGALLPVLAEQLGIPHVKPAECPVDAEALGRVPATFAGRYGCFPIGMSGNTLTLAVSDPFDFQALDELRLLLGCDIRPVLAEPRGIQEAIARHYGIGASAVERLLDAAPQEPSGAAAAEDLTAEADTASVVAFVNQLILSAVKDRSTDIHIEPFERQARVRQRVDGVMYDVNVPPELFRLHQAVVSRIKVMSNLDVAERRLPQDGRVKVRLEDQELDLRVSILPTVYGETVNLRILTPTMLYSLEHLGLSPEQRGILERLISRPHGIIFVTGPTGSGKTTTLYACLAKLHSPRVKILTIEDPVEYQLQGITQLQVHPRIGFTFAHGLRSMLRHDPDIMMVGEVRDPETAEITIRSALTGHLVFSTLHTNDAAGGVARLLDMGVEPYLVASSVLAFAAQRLVRVVCRACAEPRPPEPGLIEEFGVPGPAPASLRYGRGCEACKGTGFQGRTAIYEFLLLSETLQQLVLRHASARELRRQAEQEGMIPLRLDGWSKVLQGVTTPEEVLRVT
ncbi:MAG TPA: ATPase, T2SS/T4P/T4SS family [bacterium]